MTARDGVFATTVREMISDSPTTSNPMGKAGAGRLAGNA
jgi:hypothetical protein